MQSRSKIDFRIPSKVLGDHTGDSDAYTPKMETESGLVSEDEGKFQESENVP